jgi:hypothetical protein
MKQFFFLFAMLASIAASATVTVTPISVDYSTKAITFKVAWTGTKVPHNNRVWVWVDFCSVNGTTPDNSFSTATISNATRIAGNGTVIYSSTNTRGFFVEYSSATNTGTTVTATLGSPPMGKFNWCAYGSDMPPNATVNAGGGYTIRGTKPFTINGVPGYNSNAFGAGTCITTITDPTGRPDGFAEMPAVTGANSPSRCNAGAVTLSVTASGGITTGNMTYTWTIGSNNYTTTINSYTTGSLSSSVAYTVKVKNANECESSTAGGYITVNSPGTHGQSSSPCGCADGTTECSDGVCKNNTTYTIDGNCSATCDERIVSHYNQCGWTSDGTRPDTSCSTNCGSYQRIGCLCRNLDSSCVNACRDYGGYRGNGTCGGNYCTCWCNK